jgi:hypothetical protein
LQFTFLDPNTYNILFFIDSYNIKFGIKKYNIIN